MRLRMKFLRDTSRLTSGKENASNGRNTAQPIR